jgi:hypothetical protein
MRTRDDECNDVAGSSAHFRNTDISGRRACADEVQHLTGCHAEVFGHVGRYERGGAVRRNNGRAVDRDPQGKRRGNPHLPSLTAEWRGELRCVRLCGGDLCDD